MPNERVLWMSACPISMMSTSYRDNISVMEAVSPGRSSPLIRIKMSSVFVFSIRYGSNAVSLLVYKDTDYFDKKGTC